MRCTIERSTRWLVQVISAMSIVIAVDRFIGRGQGSRIAIELMKVAAKLLGVGMTYDVPEQDLSIDWTRLPALPRSRFFLRNVELRP